MKSASSNPEVVRKWRWVSRTDVQHNVGLATGATADTSVKVIAVDVDVNGADGDAALAELASELGEPLPPVPFENLTGRGRHLLFSYSAELTLRNSASKLRPKVDVRGEEGYIIFAGSLHRSGVYYEAKGKLPPPSELPELPSRYAAAIAAAKKTPATSATASPAPVRAAPQFSASYPRPLPESEWPPVPERVRRAAAYLARVPGAVSGNHGHDTTFSAALAVANDFAIPEPEAWSLLVTYNARCVPPWDEPALRRKLLEASTKARRPRGCKLTRPTFGTFLFFSRTTRSSHE